MTTNNEIMKDMKYRRWNNGGQQMIKLKDKTTRDDEWWRVHSVNKERKYDKGWWTMNNEGYVNDQGQKNGGWQVLNIVNANEKQIDERLWMVKGAQCKWRRAKWWMIMDNEQWTIGKHQRTQWWRMKNN